MSANDQHKADLHGFEDAASIRRKSLLDLNAADLSGTTITFRENGQNGFIVHWPREFANLQKLMECHLYFAGAVLCPLVIGLPILFMGEFRLGTWLVMATCLLLSAYMVLTGYNTMKAEYFFNLTLDAFRLEKKHPLLPQLFDKTITIPYNELRSFDLNRSGEAIEKEWGLVLSITSKVDRQHVSGKAKSIELLKGILEVLLLKVKASRKKANMDDAIQIV